MYTDIRNHKEDVIFTTFCPNFSVISIDFWQCIPLVEGDWRCKSSFFLWCTGMRPEKRGSEDSPKVRLFEKATAEAWILVFTKRGFFQDSSALTELYLASRLRCSELNHINLMLMLCALPTCLRRGEGEGLRCWHLTYINYRASDKMRTTIPNGQISMDTRLSAFYSIHCIS
jgi:hypothetical protein